MSRRIGGEEEGLWVEVVGPGRDRLEDKSEKVGMSLRGVGRGGQTRSEGSLGKEGESGLEARSSVLT